MIVIVLIISSGVIFVFASSPSLSSTGNKVVSPGEILHVHGSGFIPDGSVTLTLDSGLPLSGVIHQRPGTFAGAGGFAGALGAAQFSFTPHARTPVSVSILGTFDVDITVLAQWSAGTHPIHAMESPGSRSAALSFTLVKKAELAVAPSSLNFATVAQGRKVYLPIFLGNTGQQRLNWSAIVGNTSWLSLPTAQGTIQPGMLRQVVYAAANATSLSEGSYTGTIRFISNGAQEQVSVSLQVTHSQPAQAAINLFPGSLEFGSLTTGQQATLQAAVSNLGSKTLNWRATTGSANWVALSQSSGTIKSGGLPQTIFITANTASLSAGSNTAQLQFTSNGGSISLAASLVVSAPQPGSPTSSPTTSNPPSITTSPNSLNGNSDCSYTQGYGWLCAVAVNNVSTAQGSLSWTSHASGLSNIGFYRLCPQSAVCPESRWSAQKVD